MMAFLMGGGGKLPLYLGIALAIAGLAWKLVSDIETIGAQKQTIAALEQTNKDNLAQIAKIQADFERASRAEAASAQQTQQLQIQLSSIQRMIAGAKPADKGRVPRVIISTIKSIMSLTDSVSD